MNAKRPNRPRSPKTNSQGSDSDKLTEACRRRGLMAINKQPTKHAAYITKLLTEQNEYDQP